MTHTKKCAVLILAAGDISSKFSSFKPMFSSPGLLSVNARSLLSYQLDFYHKHGVQKIFIAINEKDLINVQNELINFSEFTLLPIKESNGINHTLEQALPFIDSEQLIVTVTTTIPTEWPKAMKIVVGQKHEKNKYYSTITTEVTPARFHFKNKLSNKLGNPFCGILSGRTSDFKKACEQSNITHDLLDIALWCYKKKNYGFQVIDWLDTGHEINYFSAATKIFSSRSFNTITYHSDDSTITKRSKNISKFIDEINYIKLLPDSLKSFFPRILSDISVSDTEAQVTLEYYSYPNLSEYLLYKNIDEYAWEQIFDKFHVVLSKFRRKRFSIGREAFTEFYFNKTMARVEEMNSDPYFQALGKQDHLTVNGQKIPGLKHLLPKIQKRIQGLYSEDDFCVIHGDFCFNNILYEFRGDIMKLLDPRGSFGENCVGIYGDIKYDLAKLAHSSVFQYDYIVNDLFFLQQDSKKPTFDYRFNLRENQGYLDTFTSLLIEKMGYKPKNIYFIVGLLFISMVPLHKDNLKRQKLMYIHGLNILNKFL